MKGPKDLWSCPNCGSAWGIEEYSFQVCDCCGYPNVSEDWNGIDCSGDDDDYGPYDDYDQQCEDNNPNDSRNL